MLQILLLVITILTLHTPANAFNESASIQIPGMRFYSVKALTLSPEGQLDLLAAGQINQGNREDALILAFSLTNGEYNEISREVFSIGPEGNSGKTRVRSMTCMKDPLTKRWLIVVNGKGGPEKREKGFIRSYVFDNGFHLADTMVFSDPDTSYTHGYPLTQADVNADGKNEIIYGGFSGENDRDHADIRIFSVGEQGHLSPVQGFDVNRLNELRLRINALASGDLDGNGKSEFVAAGRTVETEIEYAAFAVFSAETLTWKRLTDIGSCRYRYATITDMTGDGRPELVLGGRINQGNTYYALLDIWQADKGDMRLISRYRFTGPGSTRLRVVEPLPGSPGRMIIGGRIETIENCSLKWKGFIQQVMLESGTLWPCSEQTILDKDWETRVRTIDVYGNSLIAAGFTEDKTKKSTAFVSIYQLK